MRGRPPFGTLTCPCHTARCTLSCRLFDFDKAEIKKQAEPSLTGHVCRFHSIELMSDAASIAPPAINSIDQRSKL